jgi:hypothetical protein
MFYINSKESFENYYIDSNKTQHDITKIPIVLNDIIELKYSSKENDNLKFVTTKGGYNNVSSENQLTTINGKETRLMSLHLQNTVPFSGILL